MFCLTCGIVLLLCCDGSFRHTELQRVLSERDSTIAQVKQRSDERVQTLRDDVTRLTSRAESLEASIRQSEWDKEDLCKQKDAIIEK